MAIRLCNCVFFSLLDVVATIDFSQFNNSFHFRFGWMNLLSSFLSLAELSSDKFDKCSQRRPKGKSENDAKKTESFQHDIVSLMFAHKSINFPDGERTKSGRNMNIRQVLSLNFDEKKVLLITKHFPLCRQTVRVLVSHSASSHIDCKCHFISIAWRQSLYSRRKIS